MSLFQKVPGVLESDFSGTVVEGNLGSEFKVGDAVFGYVTVARYLSYTRDYADPDNCLTEIESSLPTMCECRLFRRERQVRSYG